MSQTTFKYSNGEVTVIWKPTVCIHSGICAKGLHEVFDPKNKPWISIEGATTEKIIEQVKKCPSGALSFVMNEEKTTDDLPDRQASGSQTTE